MYDNRQQGQSNNPYANRPQEMVDLDKIDGRSNSMGDEYHVADENGGVGLSKSSRLGFIRKVVLLTNY